MTDRHDTTSATSVREQRMSAADRHQRNSYLKEFIPAILIYGVLIAIVQTTVDANTPGARFWVLLPVIPMIGVAVALYRAVQRADEYGRIVMLECMALGFGVSMIVAMAFGFLGGIGVTPAFGAWIVFGAGMVAWSGSLLLRGVR